MIFLEALILSFSIVEDGVSLLRLKIASEALLLKEYDGTFNLNLSWCYENDYDLY